MKIRNKKTGELAVIDFIYPETGELFKPNYKLSDFLREWEDYESKKPEPLIEDEEIRELVRKWAEMNGCIAVQYDSFWRGFRHKDSTITVWKDLPLEDGAIYLIEELCGEEE